MLLNWLWVGAVPLGTTELLRPLSERAPLQARPADAAVVGSCAYPGRHATGSRSGRALQVREGKTCRRGVAEDCLPEDTGICRSVERGWRVAEASQKEPAGAARSVEPVVCTLVTCRHGLSTAVGRGRLQVPAESADACVRTKNCCLSCGCSMRCSEQFSPGKRGSTCVVLPLCPPGFVANIVFNFALVVIVVA